MTLRSLDADSGCLSADDCSAMLFRGTLVLRVDKRTELHAFDALIARDAPEHFDFAGFDVLIEAVRRDANDRLFATLALGEHRSDVDEVAADPQLEAPASPRDPAKDADSTSPPQIAIATPSPDTDDGVHAPHPAVVKPVYVDHTRGAHSVHIAVRAADRETDTKLVPVWIEWSSLSNAGWTLAFHSAETLQKLEVSSAEVHGWEHAVGDGREFHAGFGFFDGHSDVDVRGRTPDGRTLGPYRLHFDALAAISAQDAATLRSLPGTWVELSDDYVMFSEMYSYHCGLREVRYSLDSEALDQHKMPTPCSTSRHGYMPADDSEILRLPNKAAFIAVQLVYYDGSESPVSVIRKGRH